MQRKLACLTGNQLKLIGAFFMLLDHMGVLLFPDVLLLRILGRVSYPLFAFMIAEGCHHTGHKLRYFLMVFGLGAVCQVVYDLSGGELYLNILLTFSMSILLIYCLQAAQGAKTRKRQALWSGLFSAGILGVYGLCQAVVVDYGFWGVMVPVFVAFSLGKGKTGSKLPVLMLLVGLLFMNASMIPMQQYSLLSIPILLLYSGRRGKTNLKYFFYIFYPVHLAVLQVIAWTVG